MGLEELVQETNKQIELLRSASSPEGAGTQRIPMRDPNGRITSYSMNWKTREKISQAQKERWKRGRGTKPIATPMQQTKKMDITFADRLQQLMREKEAGYWIQNLADDLDLSFEHARKMVKGIAVPPDIRVEAVARIFGVDASELIAIANADKFRRKYGTETTGSIFNPQLVPFARAWPNLTSVQKSDLLKLLNTFVAQGVLKAESDAVV